MGLNYLSLAFHDLISYLYTVDAEPQMEGHQVSVIFLIMLYFYWNPLVHL